MSTLEELLLKEFSANKDEHGYWVNVTVPIRDDVSENWRQHKEIVLVEIHRGEIILSSSIADESGNLAHDFDYEAPCWFVAEDTRFSFSWSNSGPLDVELRHTLVDSDVKSEIHNLLFYFAKSMHLCRRAIRRELRVSQETLAQFKDYFGPELVKSGKFEDEQTEFILESLASHIEAYDAEIE
jgi:hypothetical protein